MNETFLKRLSTYFPGEEEAFIEKLQDDVRFGFFLNQLKAKRETILNFCDFAYEPSFLDDSFFHQCEHIGKTLAYDLGLIYPQDVESALPAHLVEGDIDIICDLCAAPGGKSINIANHFPDSLLICNELSLKRAQILSSNLERLGISAIVTNKKVAQLADYLANSCDLIILDAPCSGEGMIRKYPQILKDYSLNNIMTLAQLQSELLENAYELLNDGGLILYSTCTYALEEDEEQITSFLARHHDMELVFNDIDGNRSLLPGCIKLSILNDTEGQFMALMRKSGHKHLDKRKYKKTINDKVAVDFIREQLGITDYYLYKIGQRYYLSLRPLIAIEHDILRFGIPLGQLVNGRFEPEHGFYRACCLKEHFKRRLELNDQELRAYLTGLELKKTAEDGYYAIFYQDLALGYGKMTKGSLKNKYPKGLRRML